jgi:NADPH-dependent ferric siderophore reductase
MSQALPQNTPPKKVRPKPLYRDAKVSRVQRITPHMARITVTGPALEGFSTQGVAGHLRVFLPAPGQEVPTLPTWGPNGPEYPADAVRPTSRAYTPRRWDPASLELDIDFVLHGDNGPASAWASRAKPGDKLVVVAPRRAYQVDPAASWYLIIADEAAIPGAATLLEVLHPGQRAVVIAEVQDAGEEQSLASAAQLTVHWIHRGESSPGQKLEAAVRAAELPQGDGRVWVACEAMAMRQIRRHLLNDRGLPRTSINTQGYWKHGVANHPDHDLGEDI